MHRKRPILLVHEGYSVRVPSLYEQKERLEIIIESRAANDNRPKTAIEL